MGSTEYLVPPVEMLFDGASTVEEFKNIGEGFTRVCLINRGGLQPDESVLDIGSGNGQKARVLAGYLSPKGRYEGIDVVSDGIRWCQEAYKELGNFRFQLADVYSSQYNKAAPHRDRDYRLPYEDRQFDLVFLSSVFTHMLPPGVANYIGEIARVLKPGGRCVATFFLLNEVSRAGLDGGRSMFAFAYDGPEYRLLDPAVPEKAVAHDEANVRGMYAGSELDISEIAYGFWSGRKELLGLLQDCIWSVRR